MKKFETDDGDSSRMLWMPLSATELYIYSEYDKFYYIDFVTIQKKPY